MKYSITLDGKGTFISENITKAGARKNNIFHLYLEKNYDDANNTQ